MSLEQRPRQLPSLPNLTSKWPDRIRICNLLLEASWFLYGQSHDVGVGKCDMERFQQADMCIHICFARHLCKSILQQQQIPISKEHGDPVKFRYSRYLAQPRLYRNVFPLSLIRSMELEGPHEAL